MGEHDKYKPWLTIQDVSSSGLASRIPGWKTGRIHYLLSNIETHLFLLLDWSDRVTDIREQFPLDRDTTRRIAALRYSITASGAKRGLAMYRQQHLYRN